MCNDISPKQVIDEFLKIPRPIGSDRYKRLRILGGEPLLNDEYIEFLFDVLIQISPLDSNKFNNGIVIQTNGIHIGRGNTAILKKGLQELYRVNPRVVVAIDLK